MKLFFLQSFQRVELLSVQWFERAERLSIKSFFWKSSFPLGSFLFCGLVARCPLFRLRAVSAKHLLVLQWLLLVSVPLVWRGFCFVPLGSVVWLLVASVRVVWCFRLVPISSVWCSLALFRSLGAGSAWSLLVPWFGGSLPRIVWCGSRFVPLSSSLALFQSFGAVSAWYLLVSLFGCFLPLFGSFGAASA